MTFLETFGAVFIAQLMVLFVGWIFKKHIEPKLDKGHSTLSKLLKKFDKWARKKLK